MATDNFFPERMEMTKGGRETTERFKVLKF